MIAYQCQPFSAFAKFYLTIIVTMNVYGSSAAIISKMVLFVPLVAITPRNIPIFGVGQHGGERGVIGRNGTGWEH
jgi:hypothetical protein